MFKKICMAAVICCLCAVLSGCLEIEEKVAIEQDGQSSALLKLRLYLPNAQKKQGSEQLDIKGDEIGKGIAGFESASVTTREIFDQIVTEISMKARSWKALAAAYDTLPKEPKKKDEEVDINRLFTEKGFYQLKNKGKTILITRTFLPEPTKKKKAKDEGMGDLASMMLGSIKFRMELKLPSDVVSSNAEEQDGRTVRWIIPLDYLTNHKVVLQAEIKSTPELVKALF